MSVRSPDQHPAVLVPDPLGDRHEVDPAHYAVADEVMPAVVEAHVFQPGIVPGQDQGLTQARCMTTLPPTLW